MRKLLKLFIVLLISLFSTTTVFADDIVLTTEVEVEINGKGTVEIIGNRNLPEVTRLTESGKFILTFTNPVPGDRYTYHLDFVKDDDTLIYENVSYNIVVEPFEIGDDLQVIAWIYEVGSDEKLEKAVFNTREKDIKPTFITPKVEKIIPGDPLTEDIEFTFTLNGIDGVEYEDKKSIIGAGTVEFDTIEFVREGTYRYLIIEEEGAMPEKGTLTYDKSKYYLVVKVEKEGVNLIASTTITKNGADEVVSQIIFENPYECPEEPTPTPTPEPPKPTPEQPNPILPPINTGTGILLLGSLGIFIVAGISLVFLKKRKDK